MLMGSDHQATRIQGDDCSTEMSKTAPQRIYYAIRDSLNRPKEANIDQVIAMRKAAFLGIIIVLHYHERGPISQKRAKAQHNHHIAASQQRDNITTVTTCITVKENRMNTQRLSQSSVRGSQP